MKFGSWWLTKIEALEGETEIFSVLANRTQSTNRAVGGKLFVTNRRLLFAPHLFDAVLGGETRAILLSEIAAVSKQEAAGDTFGGGLRSRLRIDLKSGAEFFIVNKLDQLIEKLQSHIALNGNS